MSYIERGEGGKDVSFLRLPFPQVVDAITLRLSKDPYLNLTEFQIAGSIEKDDLRTAVSLPYELLFTADDNEHVIATYYEGFRGMGQDDQYDAYAQRFQHSRLNAHTHTRGLSVLSLQDLLAFRTLSDQTQILLIHPQGISQFQKPATDLHGMLLNNGRSPADETQFSALLDEFQAQKGISFDGFNAGAELPTTLQDQLATEFVTRTGMLVEPASWESGRIDRMIDILNGRNQSPNAA